MHVTLYVLDIRGVEEILKHYPDQINIKNRTQKTPLYFAALNGHADIVAYLLSQQVSYTYDDFMQSLS